MQIDVSRNRKPTSIRVCRDKATKTEAAQEAVQVEDTILSCEAGSSEWQDPTLVVLLVAASSHSVLFLDVLGHRTLGCLGLGLVSDFVTIFLCVAAVVLFTNFFLGFFLLTDVFLFGVFVLAVTILNRDIFLLVVGGSSLGLLCGRSLVCCAEE